MNKNCSSPEISTLEIPMDSWTKPFWEATAKHTLMLPACADCHQFRWPPGPFCPSCRSQHVEWLPAGNGRIYSFTLIPNQTKNDEEHAQPYTPALIEFPQAGAMRIIAAIVDTPLSAIAIGKAVEPVWRQANNCTIPGFRVTE